MRHHVKITGDGPRGTVHVDGHDISNVTTGTSVTFNWRAGDLPEVVLDLLTITSEVDAREVIVHLPAQTHDALVALGWTPPPGPNEARAGQTP